MALTRRETRDGGAFRRSVSSFVTTLTTPLLPQDFLDLVHPSRPAGDLRALVLDVRPETNDAATITLRPSRGWVGHRPGQYVRIGLDVDGVRHWRAYSITSPPTSAEAREPRLTITVKAIPDGVVSTHLVRRLRPGATILLDQATGEFTLPWRLPAKILFLTAGSGITPVAGMLRSLAPSAAEQTHIEHLHIAPTRSAAIFATEFAHRNGNYRFQLRVDDEHDVTDLARDLPALIPDWAERQTWACGPVGLLDAAQALWDAAGATNALHTERFRTTLKATGHGGRIQFGENGIETTADGATSILEAGERAGAILPSGCRMGICYGCVLPLRDGAVTDLRTGETIVAGPGDAVRIQTCISAVAGTARLEC